MNIKGYYSLIQYVPDPSRLEAINIGVLLLCPERPFLDLRLVSGNQRLKRFFGAGAEVDLDWIKAQKSAIENRIHLERKSFGGLEDLQGFIATRANEVRLTPPRPMKVANPERDLQELFDKLVEEPQVESREETGMTSVVSPKESLEKALANVRRKPKDERRNLKVAVSLDNRSLDIPYAYKNGRWNLLLPVSMPRTTPMNKVYQLAVEGRYLHDTEDAELGKRKLIVISDPLGKRDEDEAAKRIWNANEVGFYHTDELDRLVQKIETH